ncbi:hypothetical protein Lal_00041777 [Lupinus albus]|nr:hypothetical protein Lal_00041777 [Lupinus albus]
MAWERRSEKKGEGRRRKFLIPEVDDGSTSCLDSFSLPWNPCGPKARRLTVLTPDTSNIVMDSAFVCCEWCAGFHLHVPRRVLSTILFVEVPWLGLRLKGGGFECFLQYVRHPLFTSTLSTQELKVIKVFLVEIIR